MDVMGENDNCPSPILRLPNELITEIAAAQKKGQLNKSELTLSHVCRRFHRAVTGTSALWTWVELDFSLQGSMSLSQLYLERSAEREIKVTLRAPCDLEERSLHLLIPHIPRISQLTFTFGTHQALDTVLAPFAEVAAPCLKHVAIENKSSTDYVQLPADLFSLGSPKITSFSMYSCATAVPPPQWFSALKRLVLKESACLINYESDIFHDITTQLPFLTHLYLDIDCLPFEHGSGIASKCLETLHLKFSDEGAETILDALTFFDTPALRRLYLHDTHGDQIHVLFNSKNHAQSAHLSFPTLTSLSFISKQGRDQCVKDESVCVNLQAITAPPLHLLPALSSLALVKQCFTAKILSDLFGPNSLPWPLLDTVSLSPLEADMDDVYAVLQEVVQWKRERVEAIPTFRLCPSLFDRGYWKDNGVDVELLEGDDSA